jgi:membrane protein DedA with SNARE-associated domain
MEGFLDSYGYIAVFLGTILEGETVLILGGFLAHQGYLRLFPLLTLAAAGSLTGDFFYFWLGRKYGVKISQRFPSVARRLLRTRRFADKNQDALILSMRFMYGFRVVIPLALGMSGVSSLRYFVLNVVAAVLWSAIIGSAGYFFGAALRGILGTVRHIELEVVAAVAVTGIIVWIAHLVKSHRSPG